MSLFEQLQRFSREDVVEAAWNQILVTSSLRTESTWKALRDYLSSDHQLDMADCICTGFGPVEEAIGIVLLTRDRRVVFGEFSELTRDRCEVKSWDDDQLIDPDSVNDRVAVYFQSTESTQAWFDEMVAQCGRRDQQLRVTLGDRYREAALLQTDEYLDFHSEWLVPRLTEHFTQS